MLGHAFDKTKITIKKKKKKSHEVKSGYFFSQKQYTVKHAQRKKNVHDTSGYNSFQKAEHSCWSSFFEPARIRSWTGQGLWFQCK